MGQAKLDGSIIERKKGVWEVQISLGRDPLTGKYRKVSRMVHGTKRDAARELKRLNAEKDEGIDLAASKVTLAQMAEIWFEAKRASGACGKSQLGNLKSQLAHIVKRCGNVTMQKLTPVAIERAYMVIRAEDGISATTLKKVHITLKSVCEKAVEYGVIARNPCANVTPPKPDPVQRNSLNEVEAARLRKRLDELCQDELGQLERSREKAPGEVATHGVSRMSHLIAVHIGLATGMRRGEVLALQWGSVDLERGILTVRQSLAKDGEIKGPKSRAGLRRLAVDGGTAKRLRAWKDAQGAYLRGLGMIQTDNTPVCCNNSGRFLRSGNFYRFWAWFREESGFPGLKFHELRHTQATQLLSKGCDLKTVQTRLGHSSAALTLGTYAHAVPANDSAAAELIGQIMSEEGKGGEVLSFKTA